MDFSRRSYQKELLDNPDLPTGDLQVNMQELQIINSYLGGHRVSIRGLKALAGDAAALSVCEIGCGGGDNLRVMENWCLRHQISLHTIGVDIHPGCIAAARQKTDPSTAKLIVSDFRELDFAMDKPDIIFASLFCHHFTDEELLDVLSWMQRNARHGFFINDLHRHPIAYYAIKFITRLFSKSYLVRHDAPLSVRRGFRRKEWERLLEAADCKQYQLSWQWAFRWLIVIKHKR